MVDPEHQVMDLEPRLLWAHKNWSFLWSHLITETA